MRPYVVVLRSPELPEISVKMKMYPILWLASQVGACYPFYKLDLKLQGLTGFSSVGHHCAVDTHASYEEFSKMVPAKRNSATETETRK